MSGTDYRSGSPDSWEVVTNVTQNVIVNFTKENTPTFENSYSHIVIADKPESGMYADDATPPTVTQVLALESCKVRTIQ